MSVLSGGDRITRWQLQPSHLQTPSSEQLGWISILRGESVVKISSMVEMRGGSVVKISPTLSNGTRVFEPIPG